MPRSAVPGEQGWQLACCWTLVLLPPLGIGAVFVRVYVDPAPPMSAQVESKLEEIMKGVYESAKSAAEEYDTNLAAGDRQHQRRASRTAVQAGWRKGRNVSTFGTSCRASRC